MRQFTFAVKLTPDKDDGGYVVTRRDLPEAITQGETIEQALVEAADGRCLPSQALLVPTSSKVDNAPARVSLATRLKGCLSRLVKVAESGRPRIRRFLWWSNASSVGGASGT